MYYPRRNTRRRKYRGFLLGEMLVVMFVGVMMLPIITTALRILSSFAMYDPSIGDMLSMEKLKRELILAYDIDLVSNKLTFKIGEDDHVLMYDGSRLYLTPGYQLFLDDVESLCFIKEDDDIYLEYLKDQKEFKVRLR